MLTQDRDTPRREGDYLVLPVAAAVEIFAGALVGIDEDGNAIPAANEDGVVAAGRAEEHVDNRAGDAGARTIRVRRGVFRWNNDASLPVTQAHVGRDCYIRDDETVRAFDDSADAPNPLAGKVIEVEPSGVWVETR